MNNIVERYKERAVETYLATHPNIDSNIVRTLVGELVNERVKDIPCVMHNNMTHERQETSMINVFEWVDNRNPIVTGNGTFFKQHSEYLAPTVKMLEKLQLDRKKKKKEMFNYDPGSVQYKNLNVGQLSIKVVMNSDYGGSGTTLSPFYSCYIPPATTGSAKNLTTSLICCLEFVTCNNSSWSKLNNINELFDMIFAVLTDNEQRPNLINDNYSVDEVTRLLISRTNNIRQIDIITLKRYLSTLDQKCLTKLMLAFNVKLVLSKYLSSQIHIISEYLIEHQLDIDNITEETLYVSGYGVKPPEEIASLIYEVCEVVKDNCIYSFFLNDVEIRAHNMERRVVCVTDTDSLMVHFEDYIDAFQAYSGKSIEDDCLIASAFGMRLFIEHIIPKFVSYFGINCKIEDPYYRSKFVFKNEFGFLAMALLAKKMYASSMFVQEGKPRNPHKIAASGLSFKKRDAAEFLEPIMLDIYDKDILTGKQINLSSVLDKYNQLRTQLVSSVGVDPSYHKVLSIKDVSAYDPNKVLPAQMRGSIVWNNIIPDEKILPMDRVRVIPLSFDLLKKHASEDHRTSEILRLSLVGNDKEKTAPYICIPEHYHDIPEWIQKAIDIEYASDKLLMPFRQLFDAFGIYVADTPGGFVPSRMIIP